MKSLLSIFAVVTLIFFSSCKDDEAKLPANVIESADGVSIKLTWLTDGSTAQAIDDADLDLGIFTSDDPDFPIDSSDNETEFESLVLDNDFDDDTYTIKVLLYENFAGKAVNFVIKTSGGGKNIEADGSFSAVAEDGTIVAVINIKKAGNKYTVTEL